ncbi:MAG: TIGR00266 family protein [Myxococcota bacterium]
MRHEIRNKPDYASLVAFLDEGDAIVTEAGAMMAMHPGLKMETNMKGGLFAAAKRALGGESVFLNTYTGTGAEQRIDIAPSSPGDLIHIALDGSRAMTVQKGSFCACTPGVTVDSKWAGAKGFFGGESLIMLKCSGSGDLWLSSYGAIHAVDVEGSYVVDTGHIVAFDDGLTYNVTKTGGMKSLFLSGEGLVCRFTGSGRVWIQTRNAPALASFLHPFRRVQKRD